MNDFNLDFKTLQKCISELSNSSTIKLPSLLNDMINRLKQGGKIYIKKANRGKFSDYCGGKVTNECIARGKNSPDPKIRKRATFAANSRKWAKK